MKQYKTIRDFFSKCTDLKMYTGNPPITLFFGPGEIYRVIGKTMLKKDLFSTKWEN